MAVDSRDKRFSMLGWALIAPSIYPNPDGTVGTDDRAQWVYLYHGSGISIKSGQPTISRWGGVPHVRLGPNRIGRSW